MSREYTVLSHRLMYFSKPAKKRCDKFKIPQKFHHEVVLSPECLKKKKKGTACNK